MRSYPFTSQVTYDDEGLPLYDRAVDSSFLRRVFAQYFSDGVFYKPASALQVVTDTGMQVKVNPGAVHIQGAIGIEDAQRTLVVQAAESLDRIDTVVARLDLSLDARDIDLYIVKGTAAPSPQPPALTRDATVWELGLADLFVAKNSSTITQQRITDTRLNASRCGMVAQTIGTLDTTPYFNQIQAALASIQTQAATQLDQMEFAFDSWLETIKGKLGDDPSTALQAQVDDLQAAVGGMPLELSAGTNSINVTADENRVGNVEIKGFTTQTGSGDASPANVQEIENAGKFNKIAVIDGTTVFYVRTVENGFVVVDTSVISDVTKNSKVVSTYLKAFSLEDETTKEGIRAFSTSSGFAISIKQSKLTGTDESAVKAYFSARPLTVGYQSTEDTGKIYTGIEVEQGDEYRCEIIELQAPLHEGDTLETNVPSEYDAELIVDGAKVVSVSQTSSGNYRINLNAPDDFPVPEARDMPNAKANNLLPIAANTLQSFDVKGVFCAYLSAIYIVLKDQTVTTKEAAQSYFNNNPLRIFYKSASGGTPKNIKREEHARKTYVLTGTENIQKSGLSNNSYYLDFIGIAQKNDAGTVICNQAKAISGSEASSYTGWGVCSDAGRANTLRITSPETTLEGVKSKIAEAYASENPFIIEYELATPEVYADTPVEIKNPRGAFTVSSEAGTVCTPFVRSVPTAEEIGALPASGGVYSTSAPVNTGKVWIDGSPIYMQVFTFNTQKLPQLQYSTLIPLSSFDGLSHFVDIRGHIYLEGGNYPIILPCAIGDSVVDIQCSSRGVELFRNKLSDITFEGNTPYPTGATNNIMLVVEYSKIGG